MYEDLTKPVKPKLTAQQINFCFIYMLRSPDLFQYARQHLKPQHFNNAGELHYALVWSSALAAAARSNNILPKQGAELIVAMELLSKIDAANGEIIPETQQRAEDLLAWLFDTPEDALNPTYYRPIIQDLIVERTIISEMAKDMDAFRAVGRPADIAKNLATYNTKLQSILIDPTQAGQTAFPLDFKPKKINKFTTGQEWLDVFMNGGQAPGEVYVMAGPSGVGKTTMCVMLALGGANQFCTQNLLDATTKKKVSCVFSWEQELEALRLRFWANAANIDSSRLEDFADEKIELSTTGNLTSEEMIEHAAAIAAWPKEKGGYHGERERLEKATKKLADYVRIFDFSGGADNPNVGIGGVEEVAAALKALQQEGKEIGLVIMDYAHLHVRKMMAARGDPINNQRFYLHNYVDECKVKLAIPFKCPVWVFAQLNPEANKRAPTAPQHHSMISECGSFAENAWFAFCFSTKDKANDMCQIFCTKERRARGDRPPVILKIDGKYCRLVDISKQWTADEYTKTFARRTEKARQPAADVMQRMKQAAATGPTRTDTAIL